MKSNNLNFSASKKSSDGNTELIVKINLNDECKNGHQDFKITADGYEKQKNDRFVWSFGGCCHDEILKLFPEFKIFVDLHLCDYNGVPMYAVANGFYHLKNGFEMLNEKTKKEYFCDYYRVTSKQYDCLEKSENKIEFGILLEELGVLKQWKKQAKQAIKKLEEMTGKQFINDSKKSNYDVPTKDQIKDFKAKKKNGYFTPEKKKERVKAKKKELKEKLIQNTKEARNKAVKKLDDDLAVKLWLIDRDIPIENIIFYNHTNTLKFNWRNYGKKFSESDFNKIVDSVTSDDLEKLPQGIVFELDKIRKWNSLKNKENE